MRWIASTRAVAIVAGAVLVVTVTTVRDCCPLGRATPATPVVLVPNAQGYVRVQTAAQNIRCSLTADLVACQSSDTNWPRHPDGTPFAAVSLNADGDVQAVDADLGRLAGLTTMQERDYTAGNWTIAAGDYSVEFTNQRSGHGMDIGDDGVRSF